MTRLSEVRMVLTFSTPQDYWNFWLYVLPLVVIPLKKIQCDTVTSLRCCAARYAITLTRAIYTHVWTRKGVTGWR